VRPAEHAANAAGPEMIRQLYARLRSAGDDRHADQVHVEIERHVSIPSSMSCTDTGNRWV